MYYMHNNMSHHDAKVDILSTEGYCHETNMDISHRLRGQIIVEDKTTLHDEADMSSKMVQMQSLPHEEDHLM
jgi:hypothetical protein